MNQQTAENIADVLRILGHPVRLQIMESLRKGERTVGDIASAVHREEAYVSHQLSIMETHNLLSRTHCGRNVYYNIRDVKVIQCLHCTWAAWNK